MALYDQRVFRVGDCWWVAQVQSASGVGPSPMIEFQFETVVFTNVSNRAEPSKLARIAAGSLNHLDHDSIVMVLRGAIPGTTRVELRPVNPPSGIAVQGTPYRDADGLNWTISPTVTAGLGPNGRAEERHVLDVICRDDSALRRLVPMTEATIYDDAKRMGTPIDDAVVKLVKSAFEKLASTDDNADKPDD